MYTKSPILLFLAFSLRLGVLYTITESFSRKSFGVAKTSGSETVRIALVAKPVSALLSPLLHKSKRSCGIQPFTFILLFFRVSFPSLSEVGVYSPTLNIPLRFFKTIRGSKNFSSLYTKVISSSLVGLTRLFSLSEKTTQVCFCLG